MHWIDALARVTRRINRLFTLIASVLVVAIMLVVLQDIFRRYVLHDPSTWALDVASFLLVYTFFLALAPALESGTHVTVDLFAKAMPRRMRTPVNLLGWVLVLVFGAVFFWKLWEAAADVIDSNELFPTATPMRVKYIWIIGPIGAAQFILTAIVMMAASLRPNSQTRPLAEP